MEKRSIEMAAMNQQQILTELKKRYPYLMQEFGVQHLGVFGSVTTDTFQDESDVDVVVSFSRPLGLRFIELTEYLENALQRKVDVLTEEGLEHIRMKSVLADIKRKVVYVQA
jgi:predicted nucleotidyltransferase